MQFCLPMSQPGHLICLKPPADRRIRTFLTLELLVLLAGAVIGGIVVSRAAAVWGVTLCVVLIMVLTDSVSRMMSCRAQIRALRNQVIPSNAEHGCALFDPGFPERERVLNLARCPHQFSRFLADLGCKGIGVFVSSTAPPPAEGFELGFEPVPLDESNYKFLELTSRQYRRPQVAKPIVAQWVRRMKR